MRTITINAVEGQGWAVAVDGVENAQLFRSGAKAERSARELAERLAGAGQTSQITIHLRGGALGGRFVTTPPGRRH